jgi:hypothetical protein
VLPTDRIPHSRSVLHMSQKTGTTRGLAAWHQVVESRDPGRLHDLIAEDAIFWSPVLFRPQRGRDLVIMYLTGAMHVLGLDTFHYVREVVAHPNVVLEFETEVDGRTVNGVDMIRFNDDGLITDFKVMLRPESALHTVRDRMAELLT